MEDQRQTWRGSSSRVTQQETLDECLTKPVCDWSTQEEADRPADAPEEGAAPEDMEEVTSQEESESNSESKEQTPEEVEKVPFCEINVFGFVHE